MKKLIVSLLLFLPLGLQANQADEISRAPIDSLMTQLAKASEDTIKVGLYNSLSYVYTSQPDSLYKYAMMAMELSEKINWKKGFEKSAIALGRYYTFTNQEDEILKLGQKVFDSDPDPYVAMVFGTSIAPLYTLNKQYDKALECLDQTLGIEGLGNAGKALVYSYKAQTYQAMEKPDSAFHCMDLSLSLLQDPQTKEEYVYKINILTQYAMLQENDPEACFRWAKEAKELFEAIADEQPHLLVHVSMVYAHACNKMASLEKLSEKEKRCFLSDAVENANLSLKLTEMRGNEAPLILTNRKTLYEAYKQLGEYKKAFEELEKYQEFHDIHFSQENKNKLAAVEREREAEKYEYEISQRETELKNKKNQQKFYSIGLILLLIIVALLVSFIISRRKANQKLALSNDKLEKANELKNKMFGIINHDLLKPVVRLIDYLKFANTLSHAITVDEKMQMEEKSLEMIEDLLQSMEELLAWSKSQMSNFRPELQEVKLSSLFEIIELLPHAKEMVDLQLGDEIVLHTDPMYMKTIIRNLTTNAIQAAMQSDRPLARWTVDSNESSVFLTIHNNGKAMSDIQKNILTNGAEAATISEGLGLHIIHDMAEDIHCSIEVVTLAEETKITLACPIKAISPIGFCK